MPVGVNANAGVALNNQRAAITIDLRMTKVPPSLRNRDVYVGSANDDRAARAGNGEADDSEDQDERYKDDSGHPLRYFALPEHECAADVDDAGEKRPLRMCG